MYFEEYIKIQLRIQKEKEGSEITENGGVENSKLPFSDKNQLRTWKKSCLNQFLQTSGI